jgi:hypothetical protein
MQQVNNAMTTASPEPVKSGKAMAQMASGLTRGEPEKDEWFRNASIQELREFIHNISFPPYPSDYELARSALDIRIAEEQSVSATKLERQTDRLVNQTEVLVRFTRRLYWFTVALTFVAIVQTIVMVVELISKKP